MKYSDLLGIRIPISFEEQYILEKAKNSIIYKNGLDERELEVIRNMIAKGFLVKTKEGNFKIKKLEIIRDSLQYKLFESREDFFKSRYLNKLEEKYSSLSDHDKSIVGNDIFGFLVNTDPTRNKKYLEWLIRIFLNDDLKPEDAYKIKEYLEIFDKKKQFIANKDINFYKNKDDLFDALPKQQVVSNNEKDRQEREELKKEIRVVYKGPEGQILIPLTQKASCFLGRGTQWCTAGNKDNMFEYYNKKSPLYVIICGDGKKYQFHLVSSQLMDENDREVDVKEFKQKYPWVFNNIKFTKDVQLAAVKQNGYAIQFIDNPDKEVQLAAVKKFGYAIEYIDDPDKDVQMAAVKENPYAIQFIDYPDKDVQMAAVKEIGCAIKHIKNPDKDVQMAAVKENPYAIQFIDYPDKDVQMAAVKENPYAIQFIDYPHPEVLEYLKNLDT